MEKDFHEELSEKEYQQIFEDISLDELPDTYRIPEKIKEKKQSAAKKNPQAINTMIGVYVLVLLIINVFFFWNVVHKTSTLPIVMLTILINLFFIPIIVNVVNMSKNQKIKSFSGHIIKAEINGLPFAQYTVVSVQDEKGKVLSFKCGNNRKFVEGNPITFFFPDNAIIDVRPEGNFCPFLSYQFSLLKKEEQQNDTKEMTVEDYLNQDNL